MKLRSLLALLGVCGALGGDAGAQILTAPCQSVGGICVGAEGAPNTIYAGHILSWGDDFTSALDIVGPQAPFGKYFPTKSYTAGPRGGFTNLRTMMNADPLWTGYNDSNRGVPLGITTLDQSGGVLTLQARNATTGEKSNLEFTTQASNTGTRWQVSSTIHTEGVIGFYPGSTGSVIVECRCKYVGNSQNGWHPDFWVNSGNPMNLLQNPGQFDTLNAAEGNSTASLASVERFTNAVFSAPATSTSFSNMYDGNFHILGFQLTNTSPTIVNLDGAQLFSLAAVGNFAAKPMYIQVSSHVYDINGFNGQSYSQAAWNSTGANVQIDWIRVWRPDNGTAKHYVPLRSIPDLKVDYLGTASESLPSTTALWGDAGVTEYCQAVDMEPNEPGMGFNAIYNQLPTGVTCDLSGRTLSVDFSAQGTTCVTQGCRNAGVLHMVLKAWKADGSTFQPARFTIYRGPRAVTRGGNITIGNSSSVDIYASCDVGIATTATPSAKITSVSSIPSGWTYTPSTGLLTSSSAVAGTVTVACANNVGQAITYPLVLGTLQNETYALEQHLTTLPTTTTENAIDAAIVALKADGLWPNIQSFVWFGLGDNQAGLQNWKGDYWNATLTNTPSFIDYQGFTTNGSNNGIDTNYDPSLFTAQNAVGFSVQSNTSGQTAGSEVGNLVTGVGGLSMALRNASDQFTFRSNDLTADVISNTDGSGLFTNIRVLASGAGAKKAYRNGISLGTETTASTGQASATLGIGMLNGNSPSHTARQWGGYVIRIGSITDTDEANLASIVATLKAAVGP